MEVLKGFFLKEFGLNYYFRFNKFMIKNYLIESFLMNREFLNILT